MAVNLTSKCILQLKVNENHESSSTVYDTSKSSNNGMLFGTGPPIPTAQRHCTGKLDGAFIYNQDTYIDMNSMINLSAPYEIWVWVYCDDNTTRPNTIVTDGNYQKNCIYVQKIGDSYDITFYNNVPVSVIWTDVGDLYQAWHLLRFIASASNAMTLLVDGFSKGQKSIDTTFKWIHIGTSSGPPGYEWKGKIDLLEVFDVTLSSAESSFLWNDGNGTERLHSPVHPLVGGSLVGNSLIGKGLS